jgi:hypothetical protein
LATQITTRRRAGIMSSVLSSCSERPLAEFITEVREISGVRFFDLLILRKTDIREIEEACGPLSPIVSHGDIDTRTSAHILAVDENFGTILKWVTDQFNRSNEEYPKDSDRNKIAALATFFPRITSLSQERDSLNNSLPEPLTPAEIAVKALANTVRLALALKKAGLIADACWRQRSAIVEMVCGTILDRCSCQGCQRLHREQDVNYAFIAKKEEKIGTLCRALQAVYQAVESSPEGDDKNWAIGMELEPGPTYVLNGVDSIRSIFEKVDKVGGAFPKHVGLNVDVAHMKIAECPATTEGNDIGLEEFLDRIVHAHICDHPGMHTCDQIVGSWNPVERYDTEDYAYLDLFARILRKGNRKKGPPFSGKIALELEGCNRINWIHQSLSAMKHMFAIINRINT